MLIELSPDQYARVQSLANGDDHALYCRGILQGACAGKVLVADGGQPRAALVLKERWGHLLGSAEDLAFIDALRQEIAQKRIIGADARFVTFINPSAEWVAVLNSLYPERELLDTDRLLYIGSTSYFDEQNDLSEGYSLHPIDAQIATLIDGELPADVAKLLQLRERATVPDEAAFGYVAVQNCQCAAWSVVDFIVDGIGEIRLYTQEAHRRNGLATVTSSATIRHGFAHGLREIHWDVRAGNVGSISAAETLGLRLARQGKESVLIFNEMMYWVNRAFGFLDREQFESTLQAAEQMVMLESTGMNERERATLVRYGYFLQGAAWAGLNKLDRAIAALQEAVNHGWDDMGELLACRTLNVLHRTSAWAGIIGRIEQQRAKHELHE